MHPVAPAANITSLWYNQSGFSREITQKVTQIAFYLQVYSVVDEMFLAGEIRETSQTKVLKQLLMLSSLEWS